MTTPASGCPPPGTNAASASVASTALVAAPPLRTLLSPSPNASAVACATSTERSVAPSSRGNAASASNTSAPERRSRENTICP